MIACLNLAGNISRHCVYQEVWEMQRIGATFVIVLCLCDLSSWMLCYKFCVCVVSLHRCYVMIFVSVSMAMFTLVAFLLSCSIVNCASLCCDLI